MADYYTNGFHYVLDADPDNFVEAFATFNGLNGLTISFYVNNMTVSVRNHVLDSNGNFSLSSMVDIQRSNLNDNTRMVDIIYNQSVIYSYPHVHRPNDQPDSDTSEAVNPEEDPMDQSDGDSESLPELEPSDHDEALVAEEPAAEAAAASSADAEGSDEPAATAATVEFLPGYDTPHSPLGSDDGFLQGYDTPHSPLGSDDGDFMGFSSLFGYSNPPSPSEDRPPTPDVDDGYSMDGMAGSNPPSDQGLPSDPPSDDILLYPDEDDFFIINADREE